MAKGEEKEQERSLDPLAQHRRPDCRDEHQEVHIQFPPQSGRKAVSCKVKPTCNIGKNINTDGREARQVEGSLSEEAYGKQ
jgi:hypothetical protein